ncbi:MAG TPA: response regulator transcription factor [Trichormus sp.]|jgi:DNA-binding response OmpR family regulator
MKILLVEDDDMVARSIEMSLSASGYLLERCGDAFNAELAVSTSTFDIVILDLGLPGTDGLSFLKAVRRKKISTPCLILTARDTYEDKINGLNAGANDYVTKPFNLGELEARIRALLRMGCHNITSVALGELNFDTVARVVRKDDELIDLSPREYAVLEILVHNLGKLVSKTKLATSLTEWETPITFNALDIVIHKLRKKLEPYGVNIQTIRGMGFLLEH